VFLEKRQCFRRKLSKIAENFDHSIDPWSPWQQLHSWITAVKLGMAAEKLEIGLTSSSTW
jgi:hypothetical protein